MATRKQLTHDAVLRISRWVDQNTGNWDFGHMSGVELASLLSEKLGIRVEAHQARRLRDSLGIPRVGSAGKNGIARRLDQIEARLSEIEERLTRP